MKCPICKKEVDDSQAGKPGSTYPFCSERCRTIDLARWLDGKYQIPVTESDQESDAEESPGFPIQGADPDDPAPPSPPPRPPARPR